MKRRNIFAISLVDPCHLFIFGNFPRAARGSRLVGEGRHHQTWGVPQVFEGVPLPVPWSIVEEAKQWWYEFSMHAHVGSCQRKCIFTCSILYSFPKTPNFLPLRISRPFLFAQIRTGLQCWPLQRRKMPNSPTMPHHKTGRPDIGDGLLHYTGIIGLGTVRPRYFKIQLNAKWMGVFGCRTNNPKQGVNTTRWRLLVYTCIYIYKGPSYICIFIYMYIYMVLISQMMLIKNSS